MNWGTFITPLDATPLPDGIHWRVNRDLIYEDPEGYEHVTRAGYVTDFASIPELARLAAYVLAVSIAAGVTGAWLHILWLLITALALCLFALWVAWVSPLLNANDKIDAPATGHDNDYTTPGMNKFVADFRLFLSCGANAVEMWLQMLLYFNVTFFGWQAFHNDQVRAIKAVNDARQAAKDHDLGD